MSLLSTIKVNVKLDKAFNVALGSHDLIYLYHLKLVGYGDLIFVKHIMGNTQQMTMTTTTVVCPSLGKHIDTWVHIGMGPISPQKC